MCSRKDYLMQVPDAMWGKFEWPDESKLLGCQDSSGTQPGDGPRNPLVNHGLIVVAIRGRFGENDILSSGFELGHELLRFRVGAVCIVEGVKDEYGATDLRHVSIGGGLLKKLPDSIKEIPPLDLRHKIAHSSGNIGAGTIGDGSGQTRFMGSVEH